MKRYFFILCTLLIFTSCDDGEFIVTNFNFDSNSTLHLCKTGARNVLYIVNTNPDESIAFSFMDENFDGTYAENVESLTYTVPLNTKNQLVYRTYNTPLQGDLYFCSGIPPTKPKVTEEYKSKNGGSINLITRLTDQQIDSIDNTVTRTFKTYAIAHNVTLKNSENGEEIVEETIALGHFEKTATFELDSLSTQGF